MSGGKIKIELDVRLNNNNSGRRGKLAIYDVRSAKQVKQPDMLFLTNGNGLTKT